MGNQPASSDKPRRSRNAPKAPPSSPRVSRKPSEKSKDHYQDISSTPTPSGEIPKIEPSVQIIKNPQSLNSSTSQPSAPSLGSIRMRVTVPGLQLTKLGDGATSEPPISVRYTTRGAIGNSSGFNTINIRTPPLSPRENREFKIFHFVYNGVQKDLKVYDGTPVELVWRTLFQQLGISYAGSSLDSLIDSISILDSDGCSVVFSPEHIPHNEKLFIYDCNLVGTAGTSGLTTIPSVVTAGDISDSIEVPKDEGEEDGMKFCWDVRWNSLYCGYTIADDNRTVTSGNTLVSRSSSMPILISNRAFKKGTGIFKWRIVFKSDVPHYAAGIVSEEEISFPRKCASFGNHFPSVPWFYKTAPMGEKSISVVLDTNKSKVSINGKVFEGIPDAVYAAICFKMPFNVEAQIQWDVE